MWTKKFDGTNRHGGRQYNARPGSRLYFSSTDDPFVSYQWKIEVAGVTLAHFEEVSGLTVQTEVVKYREGGVNDYEHMLLGQTTYGNIMLKHGVSANMALFSWKDDAIERLAPFRRFLLSQFGSYNQAWHYISRFKTVWKCDEDGELSKEFRMFSTNLVRMLQESLPNFKQLGLPT